MTHPTIGLGATDTPPRAANCSARSMYFSSLFMLQFYRNLLRLLLRNATILLKFMNVLARVSVGLFALDFLF